MRAPDPRSAHRAYRLRRAWRDRRWGRVGRGGRHRG